LKQNVYVKNKPIIGKMANQFILIGKLFVLHVNNNFMAIVQIYFF
jgi:hypothetical protein